ncbi:hypothetical protein [Actinoplanes sp. N902-109]|uniref:hypothetical protein n=1 Tax=Actinoplanes sp. (strain N902-109) TaxID=649831 RepID=UPI0003293B76|nr:hypothetical protein [Actinoplanes sp. N902-109]AGL15738.1 cell division FtsK/SpoIIIE [Actinoplanes sp. N902-109]
MTVAADNFRRRVPIRGVRVRTGTQTNCGGIAAATADFEPQADPGVGFAVELALEYGPRDCRDEELEAECCAWIEGGIRAELADRFGLPLPSVRVVLRRVLLHLVDSNERRNHEAGRELVRHALSMTSAEPSS